MLIVFGESMDIDPGEFDYTQYFCEENIWRLGHRLMAADFMLGGYKVERAAVVFISNRMRQVPFMEQKAGEGQPFVLWDYHVVLQVLVDGIEYILDFDTRLGFVNLKRDYLLRSIPPLAEMSESFHPVFRVFPVAVFLSCFDSDRSHMLDKEGRPLVPFPSAPPIRSLNPVCRLGKWIDGINGKVNLMEILDFDLEIEGVVESGLEGFA